MMEVFFILKFYLFLACIHASDCLTYKGFYFASEEKKGVFLSQSGIFMSTANLELAGRFQIYLRGRQIWNIFSIFVS
jgi:hypothetical protein